MAVIEKRVSRSGEISYRAKIRKRGYPPQNATFVRKTDAQRWAKRIESDMDEGRYFPNAKAKRHTVGELLDAYLTDLKVKNLNRYDDAKPLMEWWKVELGHIILSDFRSDSVLAAQQKLLSRKKQRREADGEYKTLSGATVNRYMVVLRRAVNWCIKSLKWIEKNPVDGVDMLKESPGRIRYLSEKEIKALLAACQASQNPHLFRLVIFAISTGARRNEISHMKWADVSEDNTRITLPQTKNGEVRTAYITGTARDILIKMKTEKAEDAVYLFFSPNDPLRPIDFESAWRQVLSVSKIENFHFHDLRHTCASYLAMNGASLLEIAEVLGHKDLQMVRRYAHISPAHTSAVLENMTGKVLGDVKA